MSKLLADKKKLFDIDKDNLMFHNKALFALLIPIVVEQLLNSFMGMVDTMMVSNLGSQAISGVSLVDSVNNLIVQLFSAMATGAAIICSHYIGMKDREGANKAARQVVLTVATIAVVMPSRKPNCRPTTVTTEIIALRNACFHTTTRSLKPFARAVRM